MLKIIHGPKVATVNDNTDGPSGFADWDQLVGHAATRRLFEYAEGAVDYCGASWSDFEEEAPG